MRRKNEKGQWVVDDAEFVVGVEEVNRDLPSPMEGVTVQTTTPDLVLFRMWTIGTRNAGGGELRDEKGELQLHYLVRELPVSPRHHGGAGCTKLRNGSYVFKPASWLEAGWRPMSEIPSDWKEHNARIDAAALKAERDRVGQGANAAEAIQMLVDVIRSKEVGHAGDEVPSGSEGAGAASQGAGGAGAGAGGRGRRAAGS